MGEVALAALLCGYLAGSATEERHYFDVYGFKRYVRVDCETDTHVIEIGLDGTDSARDSIHQALFAAKLSKGKIPAVVLIDQYDEDDERYEGRFEYEMRQVTGMLGMAYVRCSETWIENWRYRRGMRVVPQDENDLPSAGWTSSMCDLSPIVGPNPVVPPFITPEFPSDDVTGVVGVSAPLDDASE